MNARRIAGRRAPEEEAAPTRGKYYEASGSAGRTAEPSGIMGQAGRNGEKAEGKEERGCTRRAGRIAGKETGDVSKER